MRESVGTTDPRNLHHPFDPADAAGDRAGVGGAHRHVGERAGVSADVGRSNGQSNCPARIRLPKERTLAAVAIGAILGGLVAPLVGRPHRAATGLFRNVRRLARRLPGPVSCTVRSVYNDWFLLMAAHRRLLHGLVLRLAAALSAGTISDAGPRDGPGRELQLRPNLRSRRCAGHRQLDGAFRSQLSAGLRDDELGLRDRHGLDLVRPGDARPALAGVERLCHCLADAENALITEKMRFGVCQAVLRRLCSGTA